MAVYNAKFDWSLIISSLAISLVLAVMPVQVLAAPDGSFSIDGDVEGASTHLKVGNCANNPAKQYRASDVELVFGRVFPKNFRGPHIGDLWILTDQKDNSMKLDFRFEKGGQTFWFRFPHDPLHQHNPEPLHYVWNQSTCEFTTTGYPELVNVFAAILLEEKAARFEIAWEDTISVAILVKE